MIDILVRLDPLSRVTVMTEALQRFQNQTLESMIISDITMNTERLGE
jgi:hypothetical protein